MPRVRKESEKYNASDNETYNQNREVVYGGRPESTRQRGSYERGSRGRGRGRGRGSANYDPDYDRSATFRPKAENQQSRIREDRFSNERRKWAFLNKIIGKKYNIHWKLI
jgi:hypothetical protein